MYSYETFPGQTIVRTTDDGYAAAELVRELRANGQGIVVQDEASGRTDEFTALLAGRECRTLE